MKPVIILTMLIFLALMFSANVDADQQIIMKIDGMTCKLCPLAVRKSLAAVEGVKRVKISYKDATAYITVSESIKDQLLIDAVSSSGPYKGQILERKPIKKP